MLEYLPSRKKPALLRFFGVCLELADQLLNVSILLEFVQNGGNTGGSHRRVLCCFNVYWNLLKVIAAKHIQNQPVP